MSFRQYVCQSRASTAPAAPLTTARETPLAARRLRTSSSMKPRLEGDTAMAGAGHDGVVEGLGIRGRAESPRNIGENGGPAEGPAGRVLLQGERVAASVRQGQVNYFPRTKMRTFLSMREFACFFDAKHSTRRRPASNFHRARVVCG